MDSQAYTDMTVRQRVCQRHRHQIRNIIARVQAERDLLKHALGDDRPSPDADRFPEPTVVAKANQAVPAMAMFEKYAAEAGLAASSYKRWKPLVEIRRFPRP